MTRRLTKAQRLALAELHHKAGCWGEWTAVQTEAGAARDADVLVNEGLIQLRLAVQAEAAVTRSGAEILKAEGLLLGYLPSIKEALGFPGAHGCSSYRTDWIGGEARD